MNYQEKIDVKTVITKNMLLGNAVLNYTQVINLYVKGGKLINIFLQKLAKMNYSFFLNYVSLFINSTFIDEK